MSKPVKSQKIRRLKVDRTTGVDKIDSFVTQLDINIPDLGDDQYQAGWKDWKDYQNLLPDYFQDNREYPITWFNNFYVNVTGEPSTNGKTRKYKLTIQEPPAGKKLCYFDTVEKVAKGIDFNPGSKTVTIELDLADPPTGMYP